MRYDAVSVDLPWSRTTRSRTVIAASSPEETVLVTKGLDGEGLYRWITQHASHRGLVVLDVPIDGCARLCRAVPRRELDDGLARIGVPILPSYKSGDLGPNLRDALRQARPDLAILESYPYAVLRVLWGVRQEIGSLVALTASNYRPHVSPWQSWWRWPPRYKRARTVAQRRHALAEVANLLRSCGNTYARLVQAPAVGTSSELAQLSDEYDAVLGLIAANAALEKNPWSWHAQVPGAAGSILTIGPPWLRDAFAARTDSAGRG